MKSSPRRLYPRLERHTAVLPARCACQGEDMLVLAGSLLSRFAFFTAVVCSQNWLRRSVGCLADTAVAAVVALPTAAERCMQNDG